MIGASIITVAEREPLSETVVRVVVALTGPYMVLVAVPRGLGVGVVVVVVVFVVEVIGIAMMTVAGAVPLVDTVVRMDVAVKDPYIVEVIVPAGWVSIIIIPGEVPGGAIVVTMVGCARGEDPV